MIGEQPSLRMVENVADLGFIKYHASMREGRLGAADAMLRHKSNVQSSQQNQLSDFQAKIEPKLQVYRQ